MNHITNLYNMHFRKVTVLVHNVLFNAGHQKITKNLILLDFTAAEAPGRSKLEPPVFFLQTKVSDDITAILRRHNTTRLD